MDMQTKAMGQVLTILKFLNARFEIKLPDGQEFVSEKKRVRTANGPSLLHHYEQPIKALEVGGYVEIDVPEGEDPTRFKKNAQAYARHVWGENQLTCLKDTSIEILRTA